MQAWLIWLMAGVGLVILEMLSGTLYLLFLGISSLLAALAAYAGLGLEAQVAVFAAPAAALCIWAALRRRTPPRPPMALDLGQPVRFETWTSAERRLARVNYRGTVWDAEVSGDVAAAPGDILIIQGIDGSRLRIAKSP